MNEPKRFKQAINALITAFFDETLMKGNCAACAVGNMVADALGIKIQNDEEWLHCSKQSMEISSWSALGFTDNGFQYIKKRPILSYVMRTRPSTESEIQYALATIAPTGYSHEEIMRIEYAFETNTKIDFQRYCNHTRQEIMEDQYNGLCAVFDVLCKLDNLDVNEYKPLLTYDDDLKAVNTFSL